MITSMGHNYVLNKVLLLKSHVREGFNVSNNCMSGVHIEIVSSILVVPRSLESYKNLRVSLHFCLEVPHIHIVLRISPFRFYFAVVSKRIIGKVRSIFIS